jgi:hypothetical protein
VLAERLRPAAIGAKKQVQSCTGLQYRLQLMPVDKFSNRRPAMTYQLQICSIGTSALDSSDTKE